MSRSSSLGKSTSAKDICILLVNDDYICRNIVADMLERCSYEAFSYEGETDALNKIWEKKDVTELILTNVHRSTDAKRHEIINHIEDQIKLKIILMSPTGVDDIKAFTVGGKGVSVYYMKSLSVDEMNNLWAAALAREKNKKESSSGSKTKRTRDDDIDEQNGNKEKKQRVVWTKERHQKFLEAVAQLGEDKAFPKKIVELMNDPTLTRANVASHLQKHRTCVKRAKEGLAGSSYDDYGFNLLQGTFQQSHRNPFQMGSGNIHSNYNYYQSRSRIMPQSLSLLNAIRLKPDYNNFSMYNDETKNILLKSVEDGRVHPTPNTSFAGFRIARDGKSVMFGQNCLVPSPVQQQASFLDMDSTHCQPFQQSSVAPQGIRSESVNMSSQLSSLSALLAVDEPMTQLQPSAASLAFDWDEQLKFTCEQQQLDVNVMAPQQSAGLQFTNGAEPLSISPQQSSQGIMGESVSISSQLSSLLAVDEPMPATMAQLQPSAASLAFDWDEQLKFSCEQQQLAVMTPPQSTRLQFTNEAEPLCISPQQPPSANAITDIFSDFIPSFAPELEALGDDDGVDATTKGFYDDLLLED